MKYSFTFVLLIFSIIQGSSQFTCGSIHKRTIQNNHQKVVAIDRFNNQYFADDFPILHQKSNQSISSQVGYFNLFISDDLKNIATVGHPNQGDDFSSVIEQVFMDVSNLISQRSQSISCGDDLETNTVNLIIATDVCSGADDCENATNNIAGTGSAFYNEFLVLSGIDNTCQYIAESNVWLKINAQKQITPTSFDGVVNINIENPNIEFGIDLNNPPNTDKIDLYSVVLHEVLHVLGFSSRMNEDGSAQEVNGFNMSFYSRYDQHLHIADTYKPNGESENIQQLTTTEYGSNCYNISTNITDFEDLLANNCDTDNQVIVFGENAIAPLIGGADVDVTNALSHLSESCHGSNEDFVMDPNISKGDDERTISESEKQILCALGYDVQGIECESCFVHASLVNSTATLNELGIPYYNSCCDEKFYTEVNVPITFSQDAIMCNAITQNDEDIELTDIYLIGATSVNASLTDLGDGNYQFESAEPWLYIAIYTLTNCNGHSSTGVLQINVHEEKPNCILEFPCDNLVCNSGYEAYDLTNYINYQTGFDNLFIFDNSFQNSVNICSSNSNKVSNLGNSNHPEAQLIPLMQPLTPGCTISIKIDLANRSGSTGLFNMSGSEFKPCYPTEALITPDCNDFGNSSIFNSCEIETYVPYCLVVNEPVTNNHPGSAVGICPSENLILQTYSWEIEHTGNTDINFLILHNTQPNSMLWVDNIEVTQTCPPAFTVELLDFSATINDTTVAEIEVCFDDSGDFNFDGASVEIRVPDQLNIEILDEGDFNNGISTIDNLDANSCTSIFLYFIATETGIIELEINSTVSELCKEIENVYTITVSDIVFTSSNKLDQIPQGSTIHYYNQLGIHQGSFPIKTKKEINNLFYPKIPSIFLFTITKNNELIYSDKTFLLPK